MLHHSVGETSVIYKPKTPAVASYPRGIAKPPKPNKQQISMMFPNITNNKLTYQGSNQNNFDRNTMSPTTKINYQKNQNNNVELLRSRRWSNPNIGAKEKKKKEKFQAQNNFGNCKTVGGTFDLYDFYVNKVNTNTSMIRDERVRRLKDDSHQQEERKQLRKEFMFHTTSSGTESKIQEWMQGESRYRKHFWDFRSRSRNQIQNQRPSFSAHPLSRISVVHHPPDSAETNTSSRKDSRRDSLLTKLSRRTTLWQQPEAYNNSRNDKVRNFKWYGQVIKAICGLKMEMQNLSISKTQQSNISEFMYISAGATAIPIPPGHNTEDDNQFLLFDKSMFSRTRATSHMPPWAIALMIEPPNQRPNDQVHHLKQILMAMKSFRENITEDMRHTVAKVVRYTKCDKGRVVLRQGHWGFDFYFIYSGSVFIQLDVKDQKTGQTYPSVENVLKSGEGFGEIAILGDGKRTASVICKEPTELCQIDRETFLEICPALYNELLEQKITFARQFPIFEFWEDAMLKKLCFLSQVLDIPHSTIVEEDWSKTNFAYFVMKGQMKMVMPFDATNIDTASSQERALGHMDGPNRSKGKKEVIYTKNAHVGVLTDGMHSDLSVLSLEPRKDIANIILVSEGVRVFRVSARTLMWVSPRKQVEEYLKKVYKPPTFPSGEEMCARYHINISWSEYKKNVINTSRLERTGQIIANIPATLKGTTGWAKWPGYRLRPKKSMDPKLGKDRMASISDDSNDDDDDDDMMDYTDRSTILSSGSSVFLDDVTMSCTSARTRSPASKIIHTTDKTSNDRTTTIDPPVYRTAAHLRQSLKNKPSDVMSI